MKKYIFNTIWIASDKMLTILGSLIVTILVARYLGPENMGMINYSILLASFLVPFTQLGSDSVIFDRALKNSKSAIKIIYATLSMRTQIYFFMFCLVIMYEIILAESTKQQLAIDLVVITGYFFFAVDIYKPYYNGILRSKVNSLCAFGGLFLCVISRSIFVSLELSVVYFTIPYLILYAVPFLIKFKFFSSNREYGVFNRGNKKRYRRKTIEIGLPLLISSLAIVFYTRFNQFILSDYFGKDSLASYNAALTLSLGWTFIPISIGTSLLTKALSKTTYRVENVGFILLTMYLVSLPVLAAYFLYSRDIVTLTYGSQYLNASEILPIMGVAGLFSAVGTITSRVVVSYSGYSFLMKKTLLSATINIILGVIFVPKYGMIAVAYIQLITEFLSAIVFNMFYHKIKIYKCYVSFLKPNNLITVFRLDK